MLRALSLLIASSIVVLSPGVWADVSDVSFIADDTLELVQRERDLIRNDRLDRRAELDAVANERARDIAGRPQSQRLNRDVSIRRLLVSRGLDQFEHAYEQIHLQRGYESPSRAMFDAWRKKPRNWQAALDSDTDGVGLSAYKASDGWIIFVAILIDDRAPKQFPSLEELEKATFDAINAEREKHGRRALRYSPELSRVARAHSRDMVLRDYFDHENLAGQGPAQRVKKHSIRYRVVSENLYLTSELENAVQSAVSGWMHSPPHRRNLMSGTVSISGMGIALDEEKGLLYFTQLFMQPR